ncbi:hypothetical protein G7B40_042185, partial [Aetokthonos hydrillicola Thurmond2011]
QHGKSTLFPLFHGASFQELKRVINITPEKIHLPNKACCFNQAFVMQYVFHGPNIAIGYIV